MFLNFIMLAGVAGAAIPLVLHLLSRARYRTVSWGAMMFLHPDNARQRQSTRLRQWLLLVMRMALVALLAVTLARPVISAAAPRGRRRSTSLVVLLDDSGSMAAGLSGHSRFEDAKQVAREILSQLRPGDEAAILPLGSPAVDVNPDSAFPPRVTADIQSLLDNLSGDTFQTPGYGIADMAQGLDLAADVLDASPPGIHQLFVVCDRQALNWQGVGAAFAAHWRQRVATPQKSLQRFDVIPVGGFETDDLTLQSVAIGSPQALLHQPADVRITLRNYGPAARTDVPLTIFNGDAPLARIRVAVAANATAVRHESITFDHPGSAVITAEIQGSDVNGGDRASCAVDVAPPLKVLVIRGDSRPVGLQADYLKTALMPFAADGVAGSDPVDARVENYSSQKDWSALDPRQAEVIVLEDIPQLSAAQARSLEQYVYSGGGLLVSPGAISSVQNLNDRLYRNGAGAMPAALNDAISPAAGGALRLGRVDDASDVFAFVQNDLKPVSLAEVNRFFPLAGQRPEARVLASFGNDRPFMLDAPYGRGRVILTTTPLDGTWNTLPRSSFYLPMVQSAVRALAALPSRNLSMGEPIVARFDDPGSTWARLTPPDGPPILLNLQSTGNLMETRFDRTSEPGIYTVATARQALQFVVSPPRQEADLTPLTHAQWSDLSRQLGFRLLSPDEAAANQIAAAQSAPRELWPVLLALLIVLGVGEVLIERVLSGASRWRGVADLSRMLGAAA